MRRLSDDALKGIPLGGKKIKHYLSDEDGNTCFMGAVGLGVNRSPSHFDWETLYQELLEKQVVCSVHENKCFPVHRDNIVSMAIHLNNDTDMTREEIAYWVREQEDEIIEGRNAKEVQVKEEVKDEAIIPTI